MIRVSVMYPSGEGKKLDHDDYVQIAEVIHSS